MSSKLARALRNARCSGWRRAGASTQDSTVAWSGRGGGGHGFEFARRAGGDARSGSLEVASPFYGDLGLVYARNPFIWQSRLDQLDNQGGARQEFDGCLLEEAENAAFFVGWSGGPLIESRLSRLDCSRARGSFRF